MSKAHQSVHAHIPSHIKRWIDFAYWGTFLSTATAIIGLVAATIYQVNHGVLTESFLEAPIIVQALMIGGVLSTFFMFTMFASLLVWSQRRKS